MLSNSGVNRALTLRLVDDAYLESEKNGGGSYPTAIYSRHVHAQAYAELLRADRRLAPKDMVLNGGWRAVEYTGMGGTCPWIVDRSQRANEILFVNEDDLLWLEEEPLQWLGQSQGSPILRPALDGSDAYEAKLLTYCNLGTRRGNGHTRLGDISESAA